MRHLLPWIGVMALVAMPASAHSRRTDPCGCHSQFGTRHCHPTKKTAHCEAPVRAQQTRKTAPTAVKL